MYSDIMDLISAYETAQEVLVDTGVPFSSDYQFKGNNSDELKQRNDALRRRIGLDEFEESLNKKEKE